MILYHFTDSGRLREIVETGAILPATTPTWPLTGQSVVYLTTDPLPGWCCYSSGTGFHGPLRFTVDVPAAEVIDPWAAPEAWKHPEWSADEVGAVYRSQITHRVMRRQVRDDEWVAVHDVHTGRAVTGRGAAIAGHEPDSLRSAKVRYLAELSLGYSPANPSPWNTPRSGRPD